MPTRALAASGRPRHIAVALALAHGVVANASPKSEPSPPPPANVDPACGPLPASFQKDVVAAGKARITSFDKALAAKKLTAWTGPLNVYALDDRTPPPKTAVIEVGGGEPYSTPTVELVADKRGTLFSVVRRPHGKAPTYTQCGCSPVTRGGAAIRFVRYVADVPSGATYGGTVEIAYTDNVPTATWTNWQNGHPCPQPP